MRTTTLALLLAAAGLASAQSPTKVVPATEAPKLSERNQKYLDQYLAYWDAKMSKVESLKTGISLTEKSGGKAQAFTGDASLLKPNYAKMKLVDVTAPKETRHWRHFVADGDYLWEYRYTQKTIGVEKLEKGGVDNTLMNFLLGMTAAQMKERYHLSIDVDDPKKRTDHYLMIDILPKRVEDQREFKKAQLVLWISQEPKYAERIMLPARVWFQQENGDEKAWVFENMAPGVKLSKADFTAPSKPDDTWKVEWSTTPKSAPVSRATAPKK